jgi:hypothetical protein
MDWRVTTVARSSLVTRCALTWSSADLASGASCSNFTSSTRSTVFSHACRAGVESLNRFWSRRMPPVRGADVSNGQAANRYAVSGFRSD